VAHSLKLMNELLHENICDLDGRPANDAVPHSKLQHISLMVLLMHAYIGFLIWRPVVTQNIFRVNC
jgi:hypothetical protein